MGRRRYHYSHAVYIHWNLTDANAAWIARFPADPCYDESTRPLPNPFYKAEQYRRALATKAETKQLIVALQEAKMNTQYADAAALIDQGLAELNVALSEEPPFFQEASSTSGYRRGRFQRHMCKWKCECGQTFVARPTRAHLNSESHQSWVNERRANEHDAEMRAQGLAPVGRDLQETLEGLGFRAYASKWEGARSAYAPVDAVDLGNLGRRVRDATVAPIRARTDALVKKIQDSTKKKIEKIFDQYDAQTTDLLLHLLTNSLSEEDKRKIEWWRARDVEDSLKTEVDDG